MKQVRTRFAPSPTGYMHVGNLRTALYAYLLAKKSGGSFILRIEDTDRERQVTGADEIIYQTLRDAGLLWDEGPDIGGAFGPYIQSERKDSYLLNARDLIARDGAYYCFCSKEEESVPADSPPENGGVLRRDCGCRSLPKETAERRAGAGESYVIRQKMPKTGTTVFHDLVYGDILVENAELEDQILIKSDGMPTYNFANVVDDHAMGITHVIRGNEYLSSAPKYTLLYRAYGWEHPAYIHCPPVMKDQNHKLSKRNGDAAYQDFMEKGYLPAAVINYLALLGWAPKGEREIFSLEELVEAFDVGGISKSPAIFDGEKLKYINAEYIRALPAPAFKELAMPYIRRAVNRADLDLDILLAALQPRCELLEDIPGKLSFIDALPAYDNGLYFNKKMKTTPETAKDALLAMLPVLESLGGYSEESLHGALFALVESAGVKTGFFLWPLRVALSGLPATPGGGVELAAMFGKEETLRRVRQALKQL